MVVFRVCVLAGLALVLLAALPVAAQWISSTGGTTDGIALAPSSRGGLGQQTVGATQVLPTSTGFPALTFRDNERGDEAQSETIGTRWSVRYVAAGVATAGCSTGGYITCGTLTPQPLAFGPAGCTGYACTTATSRVSVGPALSVQEVYSPTADPNVYDVKVTLRNNHPTSTLTDVQYRYGISWHLSDGSAWDNTNRGRPSYGSFLSLGARDPLPPGIVYTSNLPDSGPPDAPHATAPSTYQQTHAACFVGSMALLGPGVQSGALGGASFDLNGPCQTGPTNTGQVVVAQHTNLQVALGDIEVGRSRSFHILYVTAANHAEAEVRVASLDPDVWAIADPPPCLNAGQASDAGPCALRATFAVALSGFVLDASFAVVTPTPCAGSPVEFADTTSASGGVQRNRWTWGDGTQSSHEPWTATTQHTFELPGTYVVALRAWNQDGLADDWLLPIAIADCTPAPLAVLAAQPVEPGDCAPATVALTGMLGSAPGGPLHPLASGTLDFGDGTSLLLTPPFPSILEHAYGPGTWTATWTVTDESLPGGRAAWSDTAFASVSVCANRAPTIRAQPTQVVQQGGEVTTGASAEDLDRDAILAIAVAPPPWLATPGPVTGAAPLSASMTWNTTTWPPGRHVFAWTVQDAEQATAYDTSVVVVLPKPGPGAPDSDQDGVGDPVDNCAAVANHGQDDGDHDGRGDGCDEGLLPHPTTSGAVADTDRDGVGDTADNCVLLHNPLQDDRDRDGVGNTCDADADGDGVPEWSASLLPVATVDNCPLQANPAQSDGDGDQLGDACDSTAVGQVPFATASTPGLHDAARVRSPSAEDDRAATFVAGGLAAAAALALAAVPRGLRWLWVALFSRLRTPDLLGHPVRQAILDAVEAAPGIHFLALARHLAATRGTLQHHLAVLIRSGLLVEKRVGGYRCLFAQPPGPVKALAALKSSAAGEVLRQSMDAPGRSMRRIALDLGRRPGTVAYHVRRLADAGLVRLVAGPEAVRVYPTDLARELLGLPATATSLGSTGAKSWTA